MTPWPAAESWKIRRMTSASVGSISRIDVRARAVSAGDLDVAIPEARPARDVARLRLPQHRVVRALPRLLALELVGERRQRQHDFVGRAVERALAVLEVEEHAQTVSLYLGVEKAGIVEQLQEWFGDLGVPVLALGGYGSQTYVDEVVADVRLLGARPSSSTRATTTRAVRTSTAISPRARTAGARCDVSH